MTAQLQAWTIVLVAANAAQEEINVAYEVVAPDEASAARFALADLAKRGERAIDVEHAEATGVANPLTPQGVRFRASRPVGAVRLAMA